MAISKQNILLSALLWASTGLFLIQACITIASLTSRGVNCTPRRALDLAAVAVRVKSVGRQLAASILFIAVMAPAGVAGSPDTRNIPDEAKPPEGVPFFLLIDNRGTFAYQSTATQPGVTSKTAKQIFELSHFDIWHYGTNLVIVDLLKSDHEDPAAPCLSPKGPTTGCAGAFLPAKMQYFGVRGRANFYGPKGGENSPLPSTPTKTEIDGEPVRLIFDSGKAFWGSKRTHRLDVWVAYRYWKNKYGFDHNASSVCMGAGSCVEKSFYPGITVKF